MIRSRTSVAAALLLALCVVVPRAHAAPRLAVYYDAALTSTQVPNQVFVPFNAYIVAEGLEEPAIVGGLKGFEFTATLLPDIGNLGAEVASPSHVNFGDTYGEWIVGVDPCKEPNAAGQVLLITYSLIWVSTPPAEITVFEFGPVTPTTFSPPQPGMVDCAGQLIGFGSETGWVDGTVTDDFGVVEGVTVDLIDNNGVISTEFTDHDGYFVFDGVAAGAADLSIVIPLGQLALAPLDGASLVAVAAGDTTTQDFALERIPLTDRPRVIGYWRHQVSAHLNDRGRPDESFETMAVDYPTAIFEHFYSNGLAPVHLEGVSYRSDGGAHVPIDLPTMFATLAVGGSDDSEAARQQFLIFLLNFVSHRVANASIVSDDGRTASQAVAHVARLLSDIDPANDAIARSICFAINHSQSVGAGVIPSNTPIVAYRPSLTLQRIGANPSRIGGAFRFALPHAERVTISVFDVRGRQVRALLDRVLAPGEQTIHWDGRSDDGESVPGGVYFLRVQTGTESRTHKMTLVR